MNVYSNDMNNKNSLIPFQKPQRCWNIEENQPALKFRNMICKSTLSTISRERERKWEIEAGVKTLLFGLRWNNPTVLIECCQLLTPPRVAVPPSSQ